MLHLAGCSASAPFPLPGDSLLPGDPKLPGMNAQRAATKAQDGYNNSILLGIFGFSRLFFATKSPHLHSNLVHSVKIPRLNFGSIVLTLAPPQLAFCSTSLMVAQSSMMVVQPQIQLPQVARGLAQSRSVSLSLAHDPDSGTSLSSEQPICMLLELCCQVYATHTGVPILGTPSPERTPIRDGNCEDGGPGGVSTKDAMDWLLKVRYDAIPAFACQSFR
jgi:hypothetical protein